MTSDLEKSRPRPALSLMLAMALVLLSLIWIMGAELHWRQWAPRWITDALGWGHVVADFSIAAVGLGTPQRTAWSIYLAVGVVTFIAMGMTPLVALWFLPTVVKGFLG